MFDLEAEFARLRDALDERGIDYALCGGLAMAVHGAPRATIDIDLLVPRENVEHVFAIARTLGFAITEHPMTFSGGAVEIRRISKIDPTDGEVLMLDVLLVTAALKQVWNDRISIDWSGRSLRVVSREGLIRMKRFRMSERDRGDIAVLEQM